jgi:hypothetical protein
MRSCVLAVISTTSGQLGRTQDASRIVAGTGPASRILALIPKTGQCHLPAFVEQIDATDILGLIN